MNLMITSVFLTLGLVATATAAGSPPLRVTTQPTVARPGEKVYVRGYLTNSGKKPVYLAGAQVQLRGEGFEVDDSIFILKAPEKLAAGTRTRRLPLCALRVGRELPAGVRKGTVVFLGGYQAGDQRVIGRAPFSLRINSSAEERASKR